MLQLFLILQFTLAAFAIRVPVDYSIENSTDVSQKQAEGSENKPIYYVSDEADVDSYLVPSDPHVPLELSGDIGIPPLYLSPPTSEKQVDYWTPSDETQSDWYPIQQGNPKPLETAQRVIQLPHAHNKTSQYAAYAGKRSPKKHESKTPYHLPSIQLEPPKDVQTEILLAPSDTFELPDINTFQKFKVPPPSKELQTPYRRHNVYNPEYSNSPVPIHLAPIEPTLALHLTPPKPYGLPLNKNNPTKLYPKKYPGFKPVPIPIRQFGDNIPIGVPQGRPVKPFQPAFNTGGYVPLDEKKVYQYEKAEQQRLLQQEELQKQQDRDHDYDGSSDDSPKNEQEASETNFRNPGHNSYSAPIRAAPVHASPPGAGAHGPAPKDRTEFRMHGMNGPHSYQFGYDTGKGKNRQFRFEERDNDGRVRGHYGYMDRSGKLRVVNYNADPETGFHAELPKEDEPEKEPHDNDDHEHE